MLFNIVLLLMHAYKTENFYNKNENLNKIEQPICNLQSKI